MRVNGILAVGFVALFVFGITQRAESAITVTAATDQVQLTNQTPVLYTETGMGGPFTISQSSYNASVSLSITRSSNLLEYAWEAIPDFPNTVGVGVKINEVFTIDAGSYYLSELGSGYTSGYLKNLTTNTYVEGYNYKGVSPLTDSPPWVHEFAFLQAGSYELYVSCGALPNFGPNSGEVRFGAAIPEPATLIVWSLLGLTAVGYGAWRRRRRAA